MITPAAFRHGPAPMRARAFSVLVLRYARHVFAASAGFASAASVSHRASAPAMPPKLPPLPLPRLARKKLIESSATAPGADASPPTGGMLEPAAPAFAAPGAVAAVPP